MNSIKSNEPSMTPDPRDSALMTLARAAMETMVSGTTPAWPELDLSAPSQRVFGDYDLLEEIGRGGMGVVYRARQRSLDREVAIKFIADHIADPASIARFFSEARAAARLNHPNIVPVHEVGNVGNVHYFSMPMVTGHTLSDLLRQGPLPTDRTISLMLKLCGAMDYAHRLGLLHLDLKPANVLIDERGEPLIADFGLARRMDADGGVEAQEVSGTPSFMAPEQILIKQYRMTPATDLYALGAMLYDCLTGISPHGVGQPDEQMQSAVAGRVKPILEANPKIPADLAAVTMKCLQLLQKDRYPSVAALADDLRRVRDGQPVSVRKAGAVERLRLWVKREPRFAAAASVAAVALLGGTTATAAQWNEAAQQRDVAVTERDIAVQQRELAESMAALGAWLYGQGISVDKSKDDDALQFTTRMLQWLRARYPDDEAKQATVLTSFALAAKGESHSPIDDLLLPVIQVLGGDYRQRMIDALAAGQEPNRYALAARLAWFDEQESVDPKQFRALMEQAIAAQPDNPEVWEIAAVYCTGPSDARQCHWPQAAQRLIELEPDNAYYWLLRFKEVEGEEAREALRQAAQRSYFDDGYRTSAKAYLDAVDRAHVPVPELLAGPARALAPAIPPAILVSTIETASFPLAAWRPFLKRCDPANKFFNEATAYADCKTVAVTMARDKGTILSTMIGSTAARRLARGTPLEQEMLAVRRNYVYTMEATDQLSKQQLLNYPEQKFREDMLNEGELQAWQNRLSFYGIPALPSPDWQPKDPLSVMLPEEREAYRKAHPEAAPIP